MPLAGTDATAPAADDPQLSCHKPAEEPLSNALLPRAVFSPTNHTMAHVAWVGNLPFDLSEDLIHQQFADLNVGVVVQMRLERRKDGRLRGHGLVEFESEAAVTSLVSLAKEGGTQIGGRKLQAAAAGDVKLKGIDTLILGATGDDGAAPTAPAASSASSAKGQGSGKGTAGTACDLKERQPVGAEETACDFNGAAQPNAGAGDESPPAAEPGATQPGAASFIAPEPQEGNIEYKWRLVDITPDRLQHLVTQMKWRLEEGLGECTYQLGVADDGELKGLPPAEMTESLATLNSMADALDAKCNELQRKPGSVGDTCEVMVRLNTPAPDRYIDVRIAVVGNVDSGKSTLVGVLSTGQLDNGRGTARINVFQHKHEVMSGRTSSVSQQIVGFDAAGAVVNYQMYRHGHVPTWNDIVLASHKVVTFIDLAGHEKYLKTTVFGLTGMCPEYACVMLGANMGLQRMTKEHLGIALALQVPVFVVVTKVDIAPKGRLEETMGEISKVLKSPGARKMPFVVRTQEDAVAAASSVLDSRVTPIFQVSNVSGAGLDNLKTFLNLLTVKREWGASVSAPAEFNIDDAFRIPGVGTVVAGTVISGTVETNSTMLFGPDSAGKFKSVTVKSIHSKFSQVKSVCAGMPASFAIKSNVKRDTITKAQVRKGMVLLAPPEGGGDPVASCCFDAEVMILHHPTTMTVNYQPVVHCGVIRQSARITKIAPVPTAKDAKVMDYLRTGDKAIVSFQFMSKPEYIKTGTKIIFREGRTKGIGKVVSVSNTSSFQPLVSAKSYRIAASASSGSGPCPASAVQS